MNTRNLAHSLLVLIACDFVLILALLAKSNLHWLELIKGLTY